MSYKFHKKINGIDFYAPSTRENKKYDAIVNNHKYSLKIDGQYLIMPSIVTQMPT